MVVSVAISSSSVRDRTKCMSGTYVVKSLGDLYLFQSLYSIFRTAPDICIFL